MPVSTLRHSLDHLGPVPSIAQGPPQLGYVLRQGNVLNEDFRPKLADELILINQAAIAIQQDEEGLKDLWRQSDRLPFVE